jgi:DnaJ like chaperone protein
MQINFGLNSILGAFGGFIFGGWVGAIIGFLLGSFSDYQQRVRSQGQGNQRGGQQYSGGYTNYQSGPFTQQNIQNEFSRSLLTLSAVVIKADGKVLKSELEFVKQFLVQQFGRNLAQNYLLEFKTILDGPINIQETCARINRLMQPQQRSILCQYLFGIAQSDGNVSKNEYDAIERIARLLNIPDYEFKQLKSMFWKDAADAYRVLGLDKNATDQELKKAYRRMAVENHPDKVANLGEQHQKAANEKFQKIQEAYETIKKERGF